MATSAQIRRFARAVVSTAAQLKVVDRLMDDLEGLAQLFRRSPQLRSLLVTRRIGGADKAKVLEAVLGGQIAPESGQVLMSMAEAGLAADLPAVVRAIRVQAERMQVQVPVHLTLASDPGDKFVADLQGRIQKAVGHPTRSETRIDPAIAGGMKLRVGNTLIDGTISRRLERLKERLTRA